TFTFDGGKLSLGSIASSSAKPDAAARVRLGHVEQIFDQVQDQVNLIANGSSDGDGDAELTRHFTGRNLNGVLHKRRAALLLLRFEEVGNGDRTLEYADDGKGGFRLRLTHPDGDMILLSQTPKGGFRCVAMLGKRIFAGQGDSFVDFYKQHR